MALSSWLRNARATIAIGTLVWSFGGCFALYDFGEAGEGGSGGNPNGKSTGESCEKPNDCKSGFCVDEVCCDGACSAACQGCVAALTGEPNGQCAAVQNETDPDGDCQPEGATSCGNTGTCFGGECQKHPEGILCAPSSCSMAVKTPTSTCDGLGACASGDPVACPNGCDGIVCAGDCTSDNDCASTEYCDPLTNGCVPKLPLGMACQQSSSCVSGECVDDVCCDTSCTGTCRSCRGGQTGLGNGTCGNAKADKDPDEECAEGVGECGGTGSCDGAGACAAPAEGSPCGAATCVAGIEIRSHCDAAVCVPDNGTSCGDYLCDPQGESCLTSCGSTTQCAPPAICTAGSECKLPGGVSCTDDNECATGFCTDGRCCNQACHGTCEQCSLSGLCGKIMNGSDNCTLNDTCCGGTCNAQGMCL